MSYSEIVSNLRDVFSSGVTKNVPFRLNQLNALLRLYEENTPAIFSALTEDLQRCSYESVILELDFLKNDVRNMIFNVSSWAQLEKPEKPLVNMMDDILIHNEPYGVVLIVAPWNYPLQLVFIPLCGAIAAGNCAIVKPSELAPACSKLVAELVPKYLDSDCYKVVTGGPAMMTELLKQRFDYIFFTGTNSKGKIIYEAASKFLTPVTLELNGKCPVYLDDSVNMEVAVTRIMWAKCLNAGQSCLAPDYVLCTKKVQEQFLKYVDKVMLKMFGEDIKSSPDLCRIINSTHFNRLTRLIDATKVAFGGDFDLKERYIQPTVLIDVKGSDPVMQDEIFGPVLAIVPIADASEAIEFVNKREKPLALYVFSHNKTVINRFVNSTSSGTVGVNDLMVQFSCEAIPHGGVGGSGIGAYHGKHSFDTFSHKKGMLMKNTAVLGEKLQEVRYPPFNESKIGLLSAITKKRPTVVSAKTIRDIVFFGLGICVAFATKCAWQYCECEQKK